MAQLGLPMYQLVLLYVQIVSVFLYSRCEPASDLLNFCPLRQQKQHFFVQRCVGWSQARVAQFVAHWLEVPEKQVQTLPGAN